MATIEEEIVNRFSLMAMDSGWSMRVAAKEIGVSKQYYETIVNERRRPSMATLMKMLESLRKHRKMIEGSVLQK